MYLGSLSRGCFRVTDWDKKQALGAAQPATSSFRVFRRPMSVSLPIFVLSVCYLQIPVRLIFCAPCAFLRLVFRSQTPGQRPGLVLKRAPRLH